MTKREELLAFSEERGYDVLEPPPDGTIDYATIISPKGTRCIFARQQGKDEREISRGLAHEIGHCEENAFYTELSAPAARYRAEALADRWSYRRMIPLSGLLEAISERETELWQLAERFNAPEEMIREALEYYAAAFGPILRLKKRKSPVPRQKDGAALARNRKENPMEN